MIRFPLLFLCCYAVGSAVFAAPEVDPEELPRIPPTPAEKALETFEIKEGFRIELVASEPLVVDPVAVSFDENGRLYVIEMIDYSERRDETLGTVKWLEDTDGDGVFDKSGIYAEGLGWPTAIVCYDGGVFVASSPDIIWLKDTNGDGKADERKTVFTGFGSHASRLNVQALLNNLTWGPDNRIHGATSRNGGTVRSLVHPDRPPVELRSRDFSFDPKTLEIRAEAGGGQHGMSFDDRGRKFVTSNSHHIQALMYDERYAGRNVGYSLPRNLIDIPVDGPAAEVYRISPDEPWRITRTRWRVEGIVPGIIEGGGRVSGYFTGATGGTIYRGDAFPSSFVGDAFIGDAGGNLVHRKKIRYEGVEPVAERPADEQEVEFLASTDIWFRPVDFSNAPDGALYVLDMYREVIEHPWSIPETIKKHLDLNSGNDRGRIYRIVPDDFEQPKPVRLGEATLVELVETLAHSNGWHRDTASRLLYERQDSAAIPLLDEFLVKTESALGKIHALYALSGLGALSKEHLVFALEDSDWRVCEHAVRLSESFLAKEEETELAEKLFALATDPSPFVRYQLAFTLGEFGNPRRIEALAEIAKQDFGDRWISAAVLSSSADGSGELFAQLSGDSEWIAQPGADGFLVELTGLIAAQNRPDQIAAATDFLVQLPREIRFQFVRTFGEGLIRAGRSLQDANAGGMLEPVFEDALETTGNRGASPGIRIDAIHVLGMSGKPEMPTALFSLLSLEEPQEVQLAAIQALDRNDAPELVSGVLEHWETFTPWIRNEVFAVFLKEPQRTLGLLRAVEEGTVARTEFTSTQTDFLKGHHSREIRELAETLLQTETREDRAQALERFQPSLNLTGDSERGKIHFRTLCASCHRGKEIGYALGPDLATMKAAGKASLLRNLIDPNAEVAPSYQTYWIETTDGQNHLGLIANETAHSITLRQAFGREQEIPREQIRSIRNQNRSLMPENLEMALDPQGMADLLEFMVE